MSTIYNPLASTESLLSSEFGKGDNSIGTESAPSGLGTISPGSITDVLTGGAMSGASTAASLLNPFGGVSISRGVAIVLGLLLIGGGIIMFRPETIEDVRTAATAAAA